MLLPSKLEHTILYSHLPWIKKHQTRFESHRLCHTTYIIFFCISQDSYKRKIAMLLIYVENMNQNSHRQGTNIIHRSNFCFLCAIMCLLLKYSGTIKIIEGTIFCSYSAVHHYVSCAPMHFMMIIHPSILTSRQSKPADGCIYVVLHLHLHL
jgi:hypothetical protein